MEWSLRYTDNYKKAKCRTMFMIFSIYYIFKYISICFEKLWRIYKKLIKWLQEAEEWGISGPVRVKVRHLSTSFLYGFWSLNHYCITYSKNKQKRKNKPKKHPSIPQLRESIFGFTSMWIILVMDHQGPFSKFYFYCFLPTTCSHLI